MAARGHKRKPKTSDEQVSSSEPKPPSTEKKHCEIYRVPRHHDGTCRDCGERHPFAGDT